MLIWVHGNRDGEGYLPFWSAPNWVSEKTAASGVGAPFIQSASSQLGLGITAFSPAGRDEYLKIPILGIKQQYELYEYDYID